MKELITSLFFLLVPLTIFCQTDSSFFITLMKTEFEAFQKKDPSLWMNYVDENATFTGVENTFKTKAQIIEEMNSAPDIFISAAETYDNIITRTYGNTAVLSCLTTFSFKSSDGNTNKIKFKFTRVHIKDNNKWKLVYHSAIPVEI